MRRILLLIVSIIFCLFAASVEDGINWLKNKQNTDGSWGTPNKLGFLETVEVLNTFIALSETTGVEKGLSYLENQFPENTDFSARKLSLIARTNRDFYYLLQRLLSRKNTDAGFGFSQNYQSSIWETILSIEALKDAGLSIEEILPTLNFILTNQNTDGGFGFFLGDPSHTLSTACCACILSNFRVVSGVDLSINRSVEWLFQRQNPDSGFGDEESTIYETAITYFAFRCLDVYSDKRNEALNYISIRQDANGSWDNDIYLTALALRSVIEGNKPNLNILPEFITFYPEIVYQGDIVSISAAIQNTGDHSTSSVLVKFLDNSTPIDSVVLAQIPAQGSEIAQINWSTVGLSDTHNITVDIDPYNAIIELDENDNSTSKKIYVNDTLFPDTLKIWVYNEYFSPNGDFIKDYSRVYFKTSEEVKVDVKVIDNSQNTVKSLIEGDWYQPGTYSVIWDGTDTTGIIAKDNDYMYEVDFTDNGGNTRTYYAFMCLDNNKNTIFDGLSPYYLDKKLVEPHPYPVHVTYNPDMERLLFIYYEWMGWYTDIYLISTNAFAKEIDTIYNTSSHGLENFQWIPNTRKIAFTEITAGWHYLLKEIDVVTHEQKEILYEPDDLYFSYAPSGQKIAYVKNYDSLFIADADGQNPRFIASNVFSPIKWSPNSRWLAFISNDTIYRTDPSGQNINAVAYMFYNDYYSFFNWSPNASKIVFNSGLDIYERDSLWLINSDGSNQILLSAAEEHRMFKDAKWSKDNNRLLILDGPELGFLHNKCPNKNAKNSDRFKVSDLVKVIKGNKTRGGKQDYEPPKLYLFDIANKETHFLDSGCDFATWSKDEDWILEGDGDLWGVRLADTAKIKICEGLSYSGSLLYSNDQTRFYFGSTLLYNMQNLTGEITTLTREPDAPRMLTVRGITCDRNLDKYQLEYGFGLFPSIYYPITEGNEIILDSTIARWTPPQSGYYKLRLTVFDKAGNSCSDEKSFNWDEEAVLTDLKAEPRFISPNGDTINDTTLISYTLLQPQLLCFKIYDLSNNFIREFYKDDTIPGEYWFIWDGRDALGDTVADGLYKLAVEGMIITIIVDKIHPISGCEVWNVFGPSVSVIGNALDENFYQFTLDYSPTGEEENWYTILIGNYPRGGIDSLENMLSLDPLVLIGNNYFKLMVEDRAGNKRTSVASKYVDSVEIFTEIVMEFQVPYEVFLMYEGMAAFPSIDSANFLVIDTVTDEIRNLGLAEPFTGKPKMYYKTFSSDSLFAGVNKIKFQVFRPGTEAKSDSTFAIKKGVPEQGFYIIEPKNNDTVSGYVPIKAEAFNITMHSVEFHYRYENAWYYIATDTSEPYEITWDTYFLEDGLYNLVAVGYEYNGDWWRDEITVYVENSRPTVILDCDTYLSGVEELKVIAWPSQLHQIWGAYIENVKFEIKPQTGWEIFAEDSTQPYLAFLTTTDYPDGPYKLKVSVWDNYEDTGYVCKDVMIDNTKPIAEITTPNANQIFINEDSVFIIGTADDENLYFYKLDYASDSIWGNITQKNQSVQNDLLGLWHTDILDSALYNLRLLVRDKADNESTFTVPVLIYNTNPAPVVYITSPQENAYLKGITNIEGTVQDDDLIFWTLAYKSIEPPDDWVLLDSGATNIEGIIHSWNTLTVPDGRYSIRLMAGDAIREKEFNVTINIDNTMPIAEITMPQNNDIIAKPFYIEGSASDTNFAEYKIEAGEGEEPIEWIELFTYSSPVIDNTLAFVDLLPGIGLYTLKLKVTDLAENISEAQVLITIDTLPPAPPEGLAAAESLPYQVKLTWNPNTEPDLAGYNTYEKGIKINADLVPFPYFIDTIPGDGFYSYRVSAVDIGNLESDFSDSAAVTIDHTPPILAISSPSNDQNISGQVEIIGTVIDPYLSVYILEAAPDTTPIVWEELTRGYIEVPYGKLYDWNTSSTDSGFYLLKLSGEDTYNNVDSIIISVYIDNLPPSPPSNLVATANQNTVRATWQKNTEPDLAGYILFRNNAPVNTDSLIKDTTYTETLPDGFYIYYVIAVDRADNKSLPSNSDSVEIDTRPPHAIIVTPADSESVTGIVSIIAEVEDNDVKKVLFQYRSQAQWFNIGVDTIPPFSVLWNTEGFPLGQYFLKAIATDIHNNTDLSPDSISVFLVADLTPPATPHGLMVNVTYDTVYLTWWANTEPDLAGYNVYRDNIKVNASLVLDTSYFEYVPWDDYFYYRLSAVDTAGNESAKSDSVKADLMPPEVRITCPEWYGSYNSRIPIIGTAWDEALVEYSLAYGIGENPTEFVPILACSTSKINDTLGFWNTTGMTDSVYTIKLKAYDLYTNRESTLVMINVDNTPPNPPYLSGELLPNTNVLLHWQPDTMYGIGYSLFFIYRSLNSGTNYTKIGEVDWDTSYIDASVQQGKTYYYVVTAIDWIGSASNYSNEVEIQMPVLDIDLALNSSDINIYHSSPIEGDTALIRAEIHNLGSATAYDIEVQFVLKFEEDYILIDDIQNIDSIPGQESRYAAVYWQTAGYAGYDTIIVVVDPRGLITETNESNNWAKKDVFVRTTALSFDVELNKEFYEPNTDVNILLSLVNNGEIDLNINTSLQIFDSLSNIVSGQKEITGFYWVDDTIPEGAITEGNWIWDTTFFYYGKKSHTDTFVSEIGEHRFFNVTDNLKIAANQSIVQYVYISPDYPCREIMLEFMTEDSSREHRAYWGENLIEQGIDNTDSRRSMGFLPTNGKWIRLDVPAETVGIENSKIIGMSYLIYTGKVYWDRTCLGLGEFDYVIAPSESIALNFNWNTSTNPAGEYLLETEISDSDSTYTKINGFSINQVGGLHSEVNTDKLEYDPNEIVFITATVINQSINYTYENLTEKVCITNTIFDTLYQENRTIELLPPGESSIGQYYFNTLEYLSGAYIVWESVFDQEDSLISSDSTTFYILPSQGGNIVLAGEIDVIPSDITYPDSFTIYYSITNEGNLAVEDLPIILRIIKSLNQAPVYTFTDTLTLLVNETLYDTLLFSSTNFAVGTYLCLLSAALPDTEIVITYGGFRIRAISAPIIISISPSGIISGIVEVNAVVSDSISGVDSVFYQISATPWYNMDLISGDSLYGTYAASCATTQFTDGSYYLKIKAKNKLGNESLDSILIVIDNNIPVILITGVLDSSYYNIDVTPVITITEPNLDSTAILLNSEPFVSGTAVSEEDEYILYVYASDLVGNETDTSLFFVIDKTTPVITISGVSDSTWYNHDVTPIITIADTYIDSVYILLNNNPFESGTLVFDEGEYTLYAWAVDKATNIVDTSLYFAIDKTLPEPPIMVSPPESSMVSTSPIAIEGLAEPKSFVTLDIEGALYNTTVSDPGQFTIDSVYLNPGWNLLKFTAKDKANNVSDTSYYHLNLTEIQLECEKEIPEMPRVLAWVGNNYEKKFIEKILDPQGIYYKIVTRPSVFLNEFRTRKYNVYVLPILCGCKELFSRDSLWELDSLESLPVESLLVKSDTPNEKLKCLFLPDELTEAIFSGDGIVIITNTYICNPIYGEFTGVKMKGSLPTQNYEIRFYQSPISEPDTFMYYGAMAWAEPTTGQAIAYAKAARCDSVPATVLNDYGKGKSSLFLFNLVDTLINFDRYASLFLNAIHHVNPDTTYSEPMTTMPIQTEIENKGAEQQLNVVEVLDNDLEIIKVLANGQISGNTINWNFLLESDSTKYLAYLLLLPNLIGTYNTITQISYLSGGNYIPYDTLELTLLIEKTCLEYIDLAIYMLDTLQLSGWNAWYCRKIKSRLYCIKNRLIDSRCDLEWNIFDTMFALYYLDRITIDTSEIRNVIDITLKVWQVRWAYWDCKRGGKIKEEK